MNDTLITVGAVALAIVAGMIFTLWRIRRLQYPPELRWPSTRERRSERRRNKPTEPDA